jgi:hypothetical protein
MKRQFPALRGFVIALVILNHAISLGYLGTQKWGYPELHGAGEWILLVLSQLGLIAVPTFLFISGGFFAYAAQGNPPRLSYKVVWANLTHILWPYFIWSTVFYISLYAGRKDFIQLLEGHQEISLLGYLKSLIVGFPFNFVPLIIFYYLISPIIIYLAVRFGWGLVLAIIAAYQLLLINIIYNGALGFTFPSWSSHLLLPIIGRTMTDWGLYFPLGLLYSLNSKSMTPWLVKLKWVFAAATVFFFVLHILDFEKVIQLTVARHIYPLTFVLFSISISRDTIPLVCQWENVGKRAYGLYLTDILVMDVILLILRHYFPQVIGYQIILQPLLFFSALLLPMALMSIVERLPKRAFYRYMFG